MTRNKDVEKFKACNMNVILSKVNQGIREWEDHWEDQISAQQRLGIDEKPSKMHEVIFTVKDGCGVMCINTVRSEVLKNINESLDTITYGNRKANYESVRTKDGYIVTLSGLTIDNYAGLIFNTLYAEDTNHCPLNMNICCLTERTIR